MDQYGQRRPDIEEYRLKPTLAEPSEGLGCAEAGRRLKPTLAQPSEAGPNYPLHAVGIRCGSIAGTLRGNIGTCLDPFLCHPSAGTPRAHCTNAGALWAHCGHTAGKQRARRGYTASTQRAHDGHTSDICGPPLAQTQPQKTTGDYRGTIAALCRISVDFNGFRKILVDCSRCQRFAKVF